METETKTEIQSICCKADVIPCWDKIDQDHPDKYICGACHQDCEVK